MEKPSPLKTGDYALKTEYVPKHPFNTLDTTLKNIKLFSFFTNNAFTFSPWNCAGGCGLANNIPGKKFAGFENIKEVSGTYDISNDSIYFRYQHPEMLSKNMLYSAKLKYYTDTHFIFMDSGYINSHEKYDSVFERELFMFRSGVTDPKFDTLDCFLSNKAEKVN
jgi:hypothetical protein